MNRPLNVLMCGVGEYTTGFVHGKTSRSDKKIGVVALVMFDLRLHGKVDRLGLCGTQGIKFPDLRAHLKENIGEVYKGIDVSVSTWPADHIVRDTEAYKAAIDTFSPGDAVTIFTPDDTHFEIAQYAINRGLHVLLTKPAVKTLREHTELTNLAEEKGVFVMVEFHKRFDPLYSDARDRIQTLGDFGYFYSYMSQPKHQLETFKSWAGKSSDISFYLNSHHIDFSAWALSDIAFPVRVSAMGSTGVATSELYGCVDGTHDTITLMVQWQNKTTNHLGTAIYTSSWAASAKAEVHSQQRFHYMGHGGEVKIDQAHRGYEMATDDNGYASLNPLFMRYQKNQKGEFCGQGSYGYRSIEAFVDACNAINSGRATPADYHSSLASLKSTAITTAILEAGNKSLLLGGALVNVELSN